MSVAFKSRENQNWYKIKNEVANSSNDEYFVSFCRKRVAKFKNSEKKYCHFF